MSFDISINTDHYIFIWIKFSFMSFSIDHILWNTTWWWYSALRHTGKLSWFSPTPCLFSLSFMAYGEFSVKIRSHQLPEVACRSIDISSWTSLSFSQVRLRVTQECWSRDHVVRLLRDNLTMLFSSYLSKIISSVRSWEDTLTRAVLLFERENSWN
jgi:hypothetical protein